jgi:bifunctional DNA-binding transcriptional regulator/antitoxin component of YhaV-PrlF toxin-antitoxin module
MTSKGQVTVTANLREALALKPGDRVMMMLQDDGSVRLERLKTPAEFLESLPLRRVKPMSAADLDKLAQVELAKAGVKGVGSKRHH